MKTIKQKYEPIKFRFHSPVEYSPDVPKPEVLPAQKKAIDEKIMDSLNTMKYGFIFILTFMLFAV